MLRMLMLGVVLLGTVAWAEPAPLASDSLAVRLDFEVKATMGQREVHARPSVVVLDENEAVVTVKSEGDEEGPPYFLELSVTPRLGDAGKVELENRLTLRTAAGEWHRRLRFSSLLGVPSGFTFVEDDGTEIDFTVRSSLAAAD